ncbi:hypothetical protein SeMB42_g04795 [Synchytrium endobioticum]|uniref:Vacuolar calcium ion transporter n=1 Tax=Synchytrium endobioticum TaxID=286115 RepID=A0A507CVL1_9FUNG|nr:hypothetical protein SeMB42_g04795 [Synchytrium endobioticum]
MSSPTNNSRRRNLVSRGSFSHRYGHPQQPGLSSGRGGSTASDQQPLLSPRHTSTLPTINSSANNVNGPYGPTWSSSARITLFTTKMNLLLAFIPLGILSGELNWPDYTTFFLNFFAIIPLAGLLGFATEEVALRCGQTIGGLVNATLGNAVELIVGIFALKDGLIGVVQASLLGSILSNLLLVTGFCFFLGGLCYNVQKFNATAAQTSASLMALTVFAYLIPAAFVFQSPMGDDPNTTLRYVENLSRATAIILLLIYVCFLIFSLSTHNTIFNDDNNATPTNVIINNDHTSTDREADEGEAVPKLNYAFAIVLLLIVTVMISVCADYLVGSIEGLTTQFGLTQAFVGIILLPIVGNAAEHYTAVLMAMKNKMNLAISVAIGSSMQIALLVTPALVLLGWWWNQPLTLAFPPFMSVTIFVAVFVVNSLIMDGESNWIEGAMLLAAYCILAVAFFYVK